jgi:hypothetical protein
MREDRRQSPMPNKEASNNSTSPWGVQHIGDLSEVKALAAYRALQKKHAAILGNYQPMVIRTTTIKMTTTPTWTRIRIAADSRSWIPSVGASAFRRARRCDRGQWPRGAASPGAEAET